MEEKIIEEKKYELIDAPDVVKKKHPVKYQLRAIVDFGNVKTGELGGYVDSPDVLSHDGDCWIYPNAYVYGGATVNDNSIVLPKSVVMGNVSLDCDSVVCCLLKAPEPSSSLSLIVDSYIGDLTGDRWVFLAPNTRIAQSKLTKSCDFSYLGYFQMNNAKVESERDIFTFGNMFYPYSAGGYFGVAYRTKDDISFILDMRKFSIFEESKETFITKAVSLKKGWNKYMTGVCDSFVSSVSAWFNDPDFKIAYDEKMKS